MKIVILCALICFLCGCSTFIEQLDKRVPDGETCLTLETPSRKVTFCISKETTHKDAEEVTEDSE